MKNHRLILLLPVFLIGISIISVLYVADAEEHYRDGVLSIQQNSFVSEDEVVKEKNVTSPPHSEQNQTSVSNNTDYAETINSDDTNTSTVAIKIMKEQVLKSKEVTSVIEVTENPVSTSLMYEQSASIYDSMEEKLAHEIHRLTNIERKNAELSPLTFDNDLTIIATLHSSDMALNDYFSHTSPQGCTYTCRFDSIHYPRTSWGENIVWHSETPLPSVSDLAAVLVEKWISSTGHRKNMLSKTFTHEGIGVAIIDDTIYATADFALPE